MAVAGSTIYHQQAGPAERDPEYIAALEAASEGKRRALDEQTRQQGLINASLQPALDSLADNAKQARLTTVSGMEGRGMLRSGETNTRLGKVEQTRLAGESQTRTGIANQLTNLDAGTQERLAQIAAGQSQAYASAENRRASQQAQYDQAWNSYLAQLEQQQKQQEFEAHQAQLAREEEQRRFDAEQAANAAAAAAGGGGGGGGRGGGGGGRRPAGGGGGGGGVGDILAAGAAQGMTPAQMLALETLSRGGTIDPNTNMITSGRIKNPPARLTRGRPQAS